MVLPSMEFLLFNTMERPIVNRRAVVLCGKGLYDKVYLCDFSKATDVKNIALQHQTFTAASKKLILNMDNLGIYRQY
jgi:hypothetical protein